MVKRRFQSFLSHRSLRTKIALGVILPLVITLGSLTIIEYTLHQRAILGSLSFLASQTNQVIENSLQHVMISQDLEDLQNMLDSIGGSEDLRIVYLLDTNGRVVFSQNRSGEGTRLENSDPTCQPCHRLPPEKRPGSVVVTLPDGQRVFRSMNPIENRPACQECHGSEERLIGLLLTDISMAPLEVPLATDLTIHLIWIAGTILITLMIVYFSTDRIVVKRIHNVVQSLVKFGRNHVSEPIPVESQDEIGQLDKAFNEMSQRVLAGEAENRTLSQNLRLQIIQRQELLKRLITTQEEERLRVARDLHDELGQDLAALTLKLDAIEKIWTKPPDAVLDQLYQARQIVANTTKKTYNIILDLRPSELDDLGLAKALKSHAGRLFRGSDVKFELVAHNLRSRLSSETEIALFRVFQEAMNNVIRHSQARKVKVSLSLSNGYFEGILEDDGRGFDPETMLSNVGNFPQGLGLLGMKERVAQCGGTLEIISSPEKGTRIQVSIPVFEAGDDR